MSLSKRKKERFSKKYPFASEITPKYHRKGVYMGFVEAGSFAQKHFVDRYFKEKIDIKSLFHNILRNHIIFTRAVTSPLMDFFKISLAVIFTK